MPSALRGDGTVGTCSSERVPTRLGRLAGKGSRGAWGLCLSLALVLGCGGSSRVLQDLDLATLPPGAETNAGLGVNPLWQGLVAAVQDGDDGLARVLIERLRPWAQDDAERERLEAFQRILDGREIIAACELRLAAEPVRKGNGERGHYRLVLFARHTLDEELELDLPPASLVLLRTSVDPNGGQTRSSTTRTTEVFSGLRLPPGKTVRVELQSRRAPVDANLAVAERWKLLPRSGLLRIGGRELPATRLFVDPCQRVRLADPLPLAPVPIEELVRYAQQAELSTPALLERAVRIPSPQRKRALRSLAPHVSRWAQEDPERVETLAPALRWLADGAPGGLRPEEWARLLWSEGERDERATLELSRGDE